MTDPLQTLQGIAEWKQHQASLEAEAAEFNELESQSDVRDGVGECQALKAHADAVYAYAQVMIAKGFNVEVLNMRGRTDTGEIEEYVQCEAWQ